MRSLIVLIAFLAWGCSPVERLALPELDITKYVLVVGYTNASSGITFVEFRPDVPDPDMALFMWWVFGTYTASVAVYRDQRFMLHLPGGRFTPTSPEHANEMLQKAQALLRRSVPGSARKGVRIGDTSQQRGGV